MSQTAGSARRSVDPALLPPRWVQGVRSIVLVAVGLLITFTATFHEQFGFDLAVVVGALVALGGVHILESWHRRGRGGSAIALALGAVSIIAAVALAVLGTEIAFAVTIAAWALGSALLEFMGMVITPGSRQDAPLVGATGVLLALAVLLARADLVAVIGFFGAYAVIAGVFLGIAAFDTRRTTEAEDATLGTAANASAGPQPRRI
ncbi:hypothetical protein [Leucobacter sp. G161]|uniref:hypothetical protein n=1 Tax=Leucobacter sp. G161 TaxID=663704 RepID=UPI00073F9378|nr:hypothetical protein [Leucobacter sp. G161]